MKVLFLLNNGFGIGGTIRTTYNLGAALAARGHDVEVLSTIRHADVPAMAVDPRIRLMALVETRKGHADYDKAGTGRGEPTEVYPHADFRASDYDMYVENRYRHYLRNTDADVIISTRPGLTAYLATFGPRGAVRIGQEHLIRRTHRKPVRQAMPGYIRELDAFVTVSARDGEDYRKHLTRRRDRYLPAFGRTRVLHIPNSIPRPVVPPSHGRAKLVVAAGRLVEAKRYDVLIRAFRKVVDERPDWQLRIYGDGKLGAELRALVLELHLHNHVRLMGSYTPLDPEWAKGSIAASSADREPFGMTLVEAMRNGLPVVSTDAPHGPGEIITPGVDGLLTPVGDHDALGAALLQVINDDAGRRAMAAAALANSERYDPAPIGERYEQLFEELRRGKIRGRIRLARRTPVTVLGPAPTGGEAALDWDGTTPLPDTVKLDKPLNGEGVYHLFNVADGTPVRAGARDTRALLDGPVGPRITLPFRMPDGSMRLRVWDRPVYAEVATADADDAGVHLTGRLYGTGATSPTLEARAGDETREFPVDTEGAEFRVTVTGLPEGEWSLWLRHDATREPVRLGRLRDDIVDKRFAFVLPKARIDGVTLQPRFVSGNDFSISASR